ncbi:Rhodanese-like domain-containing protein [Haematococcus lacustris]
MLQLPGKTKVHGVGTLRPAPCPRQRGPSRFCSKPSRLHSPRTAERETAETAAQMPQSSASSTIGASGVSVGGHSPTSRMGWAIIKATLQEANVKALSAQEVVFAQGRGAPVIDVRPADQFKAGHVPGAVNVPYYQPIQGWDAMKIARRVGYALFGVLNGTEVNPDFSSQAGSHVHPELGAVLYCSIGGSLEAQEGASRQGMQSRSLIATWQLLSDGHKGLSILKGGFSEWCKNGRDVESWEEVEEEAA